MSLLLHLAGSPKESITTRDINDMRHHGGVTRGHFQLYTLHFCIQESL